MTIKIDVKGIKQAQLYLGKKSKEVSKGVTQGLNKAGLLMQNEVKESIAGRKNEPASVDTGRFLNSVDIENGNEYVKIFSPLSYAQFLEFGTSKLNPRRHFGNTEKRNKNKAIDIIKNSISI